LAERGGLGGPNREPLIRTRSVPGIIIRRQSAAKPRLEALDAGGTEKATARMNEAASGPDDRRQTNPSGPPAPSRATSTRSPSVIDRATLRVQYRKRTVGVSHCRLQSLHG